MDTINKVVMGGRLTRDPEFEMVKDKWPKARITIATNLSFKSKNGQKEETCYLDAVLWGERAESARDNLQKGSPVTASGRLRLESWTNAEGKTMRKHTLHVDSIQYMETMPKENYVPEPIVEEDRSAENNTMDQLPF